MREMTPKEALGPLNEVESKHAPDRLYLKGDVSLLRDHARVAIVGSREASDFGQRRAQRLARELDRHDVVIVSGLAKGIDTAAHRAAIAAGGRTIAVLGTSLDQSYPAANRDLQEEIARHHLLVSLFPAGHKTQRWHFPKRNRVMALVSDATVIIEASESSGTVSQAWEALRLNRPLFLAASLMAANLTWTKKVLEHGALVLHELDDVLERLPVVSADTALAF